MKWTWRWFVAAQWVKPLFVVLAPYIVVSVYVLDALLLIRLPANVSGKIAEKGSSIWFPPFFVGDQDEFAGFWLRFDPGLAIAAIWES